MLRAHKIRLYPNEAQLILLNKSAGASRYAYNWGLRQWNSWYEAFEAGETDEKPNALALSRRWTKERPEWSQETCRASQTKAIMNLGDAFKKFFKNLAKHPKKHKKGINDSFYVPNNEGYIKDNYVHLTKLGNIRLAEKLRFEGKIMGYTVTKQGNLWFVSVQVDCPKDIKPTCINPKSAVGIDVGLHTPATASDGTTLVLPKDTLSKLDRKLKRAQRALARSQRNSHNRVKKLIKKQRIQLRMNNIRNDACHKFTTAITKSHGIVVIEDIDIQGLKQDAQQATRAVRHAYQDSVMGRVLEQLQYKAQTIIKAPRYYPSSKTCSQCGHVKNELPPSIRTYRCEHCGATIDRDINASINLVNYYYTHVKNNNKSNS